MKLLSNFVHQDDIILPALTVRQQRSYSAALRLPVSKDMRTAKINDILAAQVLQKAKTRAPTLSESNK